MIKKYISLQKNIVKTTEKYSLKNVIKYFQKESNEEPFMICNIFDIWNKITSPKWETYVIFKVAEKAIINTLERIKLIMNTACIYDKLDDEKIAEIYINQYISILKYNEDFLKKTGDVLAGPFAGLELISALPNQLIKITDATNFNIMKVLEVDFVSINVLEDQEIREGIKVFSDWPTIPQLYVKNEFIGGCDIIKEMYETGELKKLFDSKSINYKK